MRGIEGFSGVSLLKQRRSSEVDFLVRMRPGIDGCIRRFAGEGVGKAVVEPEAAALLSRFDSTVEHYKDNRDGRTKCVGETHCFRYNCWFKLTQRIEEE